MARVLVIAGAMVREHSRRKLLAFFAGASVLITIGLVSIAGGSTGRALFGGGPSLGSFISSSFFQIFALVATLAVTMGTIGQPFASGEALVPLTRPLARWEYALGRFLGSVAVVVGLCVVLGAEAQIVQVAGGGKVAMDLVGHWLVVAFNMTVIAAITTVFSALIAQPIIVAVVGFFVNQAVGGIATFRRFLPAAGVRGPFVRLLDVLWYVTPKYLVSPLERVRFEGAREARRFLAMDNTPVLVAWACAYLALLVVFALYLTDRKEL